MLNIINSIQERLKASVSTDKQLQTSHYAKLIDQLNEMIPLKLENNQAKMLAMYQLFLQQLFPIHTHHLLSNSLAILAASLAKQEYSLLTKILESIIQHLNKKGYVQKQLTLALLVKLVTMPHDLPTISFSQSQEIGQLVLKLLKASECRPLLQSTFKYLPQEFRGDLIKYALKFIQNDKDHLREQGMKYLIYLMKTNYDGLSLHAEAITQIAFKQEDSPHQIKFLSAYLFHQQALTVKPEKKSDKQKQGKQPQMTQKEIVTKIFQIFSENLTKVPSNLLCNVFLAYRKYLEFELAKYGQVIVRGAYEVSISCLSRLPSDDQFLHSIYKSSNQLCLCLIHKIQDRKELFEYFIDKIKKKNFKNSVYVNKLLLKGVNAIVDAQCVLDEKRPKPADFLEALLPVFEVSEISIRTAFVDSPLRVSVQRNIFLTLRSFFLENRKWQQNILSALLNYTKISIAELSVKETPQLIQTLSSQCMCLAGLFKLLDIQLHSVPQELINQLWETAKSFISKSSHSLLKRTGWVIIAEVMLVPYFSSNSKLKEILVLIMQVFESLPKELTEESLEQFRTVGLVSIALISGSYHKHLNENMRKFLAQQLILLFQAFTNSKIDKSLPAYVSARYVFFQALRLLNPKHYASQLNVLVQFSVEETLLNNQIFPDRDREMVQNNHFVDESIGEARSDFQLMMSVMKFLGHILASSSFTQKNKINFIKYLNGNLQNVLNLKEQSQKHSKIQAYLLTIYFIINKLLHHAMFIHEDFNDQVFNIIDSCWNIENHCVQRLCGLVYCSMMQMNEINKEDQLNKLLSSKQQPNCTLIYLVIQLLSQKVQGVNLQIQNLFMKVVSHLSLNNEVFNQLSLQLFEQVDANLLKNAFVFIVFSLMKETNNIQLPASVLANYMKLNGQQNQYYLMLYYNCRVQYQSKKTEMVKLESINGIDLPNKYDVLEKNIRNLNYRKIGAILPYFKNCDINKMIRFLNFLFAVQKLKAKQLEVDIRSQLKQLIVASFSEDTQQLIEMLKPYILSEFISDDRKEPIHMRTRIFLLKRLQKYVKKTTLIQDTNLVFDFLFKITTSDFEDTKEITFLMFEQFFYGIASDDEQIYNFAAQIDSIISDTMRREIVNSPSVNIVNMKIMAKFINKIRSRDSGLASKQVALLLKPILQQKKLAQSQFFSEKAQTNTFVQRLLSIGKVYRANPDLIPQNQVEIYRQSVEDLLQDLFVLLCTPRSHIRSYQQYNYIYGGKKNYYDLQFLHQKLPKLLKISQLNSILHYSLIGYVITQICPLGQLEQTFKKIQTFTQADILVQHRKYRLKGIEILTQVLDQMISGVQDLMPLIIELAPYNLTLLAKFYSKLTSVYDENKEAIQPYAQAIVLSLIDIFSLAQDREIKLSCLQSLSNLSIAGEESQTVAQCFWSFLLSQSYDIKTCIYLVGQIQRIEHGKNLILDVLQQLQGRKLRQEDYLILLNIISLVNTTEQLSALMGLLQVHCKELLQQAAKAVSLYQQIIPSVVQTIFLLINTRIESHPEDHVEMIRFLLLAFTFYQDKGAAFLPTLKAILLFADPSFGQNTMHAAQAAIKHMIATHEVGPEELPPKLALMRNVIKQQILKESEDKQRQLQMQQAQQQQSQGLIKLKMFGQK